MMLPPTLAPVVPSLPLPEPGRTERFCSVIEGIKRIFKEMFMHHLVCVLFTFALLATLGCSDALDGKNSPPVTLVAPSSSSPAAQTDDVRGNDTLKCWNAANEIMDEESKIRRSSKDPAEVAAALRMATKKLRQLPVINVDPEFALFCAELSGWYEDFAGTYEKADQFFRQYKQTQDYFNSQEAGTEAFLRGLLGDPLGKYNESVAADNYFQQQFQALKLEFESKMKRCNELNTKAAILRVTLSNRYAVAFPDFH
jgi:hypothetical protein